MLFHSLSLQMRIHPVHTYNTVYILILYGVRPFVAYTKIVILQYDGLIRYDTIWYTIFLYIICTQKLTNSQFNLPHENEQKEYQ